MGPENSIVTVFLRQGMDDIVSLYPFQVDDFVCEKF